jgi:putative tryptophan/tyrosine transport system substrate-binding protein
MSSPEGATVRRRQFIAGFVGAALGPLVARAQQGKQLRRIGVLIGWEENDPEARALLSGFTRGLADHGWIDGQNVRVDVRWGAGNVDRMRDSAKELVELRPDVLLAHATPATAALQQMTRTIPIVFSGVSDPIGPGFVASLGRPGGNITGFSDLEASLAGQWLELLTEIAPGIKRVAIMFSPEMAPAAGFHYLPVLEDVSRKLDVELVRAPVYSDREIEQVIASLVRGHGGGLIVAPDTFTNVHRAQIIRTSAEHKLPAIYGVASAVREGGLLSYGPDRADMFRRSASYVDRILRGAKPSELPVQLPVKFQTTFNAKTARTLGLAVPQSILLRADEVIE